MKNKKISTPLSGVTLYHNKAVIDDRGMLFQVLPNLSDHSHMIDGVVNIISVTVYDKQARGGHYHYRNRDNVFTVSGTGIWHFVDCNKESETYNKEYYCIIGIEKYDEVLFKGIDAYLPKKDNFFAHLHIAPGILHTVWNITSVPLTFIEAKSTQYDKADYFQVDIHSHPLIYTFQKKYKLL